MKYTNYARRTRCALRGGGASCWIWCIRVTNNRRPSQRPSRRGNAVRTVEVLSVTDTRTRVEWSITPHVSDFSLRTYTSTGRARGPDAPLHRSNEP